MLGNPESVDSHRQRLINNNNNKNSSKPQKTNFETITGNYYGAPLNSFS